MPYITDNLSDAELNAILQSFSAVCSANVAALGLTPGTLSEITGAASAFQVDFNAVVAAKGTYRSAVEAKEVEKLATRAIISRWAKTFRANPAVSDALLGQLYLPPHKTPGTKTMPTAPTLLVGTSNGDGDILLTWNRNSNRQGTVFQIESRISPSEPWTIVGTTTSAKFSTESTPGSYIAFRVSAKRRSVVSPACTPFVFWDTSSEVQLQVAA